MSDLGPTIERIPSGLSPRDEEQLAEARRLIAASQAHEDEAAAFILGPRRSWPAVLDLLPTLRDDEFPPGIWLSPGAINAVRALCSLDGRSDPSLAIRSAREMLRAGARASAAIRSVGLSPRVHVSVSQGWQTADFDVIDRRFSATVQILSPAIELMEWGDDLDPLWAKAILSTHDLEDEARRLLPFQVGPLKNAGDEKRRKE